MRALPANAIVVANSDAHTFALWYYHYAERVRPDVAVFNATLLQYDWYREGVRRLYPHLAVPDPGNEVMSLAVELIDSNIEKYPIYLADSHPQVEARYRLSRQGSAYQVMPD